MKKNRKDIFQRNKLSEVVPLATPYKINIDVANACNFKCNFCFHSLAPEKLKWLGFRPGIMPLERFKKIIGQISQFPEKIKCIGLTGIDEPLLNQRLPGMLKYAKTMAVAEKLVITTNGSLLTKDLSDALIDAGLDELIISVEALNDKKYAEITSVNFSVQRLIENIKYFYENKNGCRIFAKIVDIAFDDKGDEAFFHDRFDPISDLAYVEKIIPQFKPVNYTNLKPSYDQTMYGQTLSPVSVCAMIFYALQVSTCGNVCPCCVDYNETVVFGNIETNNLVEIWNSKAFDRFRTKHLLFQRDTIELCRDCKYFFYNIRNEDLLDHAAKDILYRMKRK